MPGLARHFQVIAPDQHGRGQTSKPPPGTSGQGYDTGTLADDLAALMDALGHQRFAVVGHDTGMDIAYALAADHPGRIERLAVAEAVLPGISPSPPLFLPRPVNQMLFHLMFNRLPTMNDQLVHGREDIFFGFIFDVEAFKKLPGDAVRVYIDNLGRQPRVPARQLRVLSGVGHYHGAEPAARGRDRLPLLGRVGQISDVVDAILFLESSPYITGEILHIDGGQTASH
jgi:pimeloyl-ACP methyl ester carboxylesterase